MYNSLVYRDYSRTVTSGLKGREEDGGLENAGGRGGGREPYPNLSGLIRFG